MGSKRSLEKTQRVRKLVFALGLAAATGASIYGFNVVHAWFDVRFNVLLQGINMALQTGCF